VPEDLQRIRPVTGRHHPIAQAFDQALNRHTHEVVVLDHQDGLVAM
jgi:hypothetical protein